ncbi:MAG: sigma-70 family RNA polymerase sigma factor [Candidatus Lambdaproteobacteria bacterium]|nr:sigma-70 family RNA polymerase sigma factor [Candidatus Lambdaproteobacteria bacterium]
MPDPSGDGASGPRPASNTDHGDFELIAAFKAGDKLAFQALVQKYESRVYNLCLRMVNDEVESQDLTQEVFLKVYRSILRYQHTYSFYTWVYRITVNCCIDYMRRRKRHAHTVSLTSSSNADGNEQGKDQDVPDSTHVPQATMEKNELREILNNAIAQLSEKLQSIIILKEIEGFTYEEIAEILNCSRGTVKSRLFRARERLKELLSPYVEEHA